MSVQQRPRTAISLHSRPNNKFNIQPTTVGIIKGSRRPASAKEWFEICNKKRNDDALKQQDLENTVNFLKKREWQTRIFNLLSEPRYTENKLIDWKAQEERAKFLNDKRKRLIHLFKQDEITYEQERQKRQQHISYSLRQNKFYPEVEILKSRVQELKQKNEEESQKMSEKLSYEAWRKNNMTVRQMETDRFNKFVREAWIDQKQWKEDEKQREEEERRKMEMEQNERRREEEEEERKRAEEKQKKLLEWKSQLDEQINSLKMKEEQEIGLTVKEQELEKERRRLEEMIHRRDRIKETRKRKELELFWTRQYQLKLKKKAADVQSELVEDEKILEDLLRNQHLDSKDEEENKRIEEAKWMKHVLEEQKKLEMMRDKEYDILFSEEAEKMWHQREADWQREQIARDKLMHEVMEGLRNQIEDKISFTHNDIDKKRNEKKDLITSIEKVQNVIGKESLQNSEELIQEYSTPIYTRKKTMASFNEDKETRIGNQRRHQQIEEHRREIERLEEEMKKLWEGSYVPPRYGRKKPVW